jgi:hypothetical protein
MPDSRADESAQARLKLRALRPASGAAFRTSPGCICSTKSFLHLLSAALFAPVFFATLCKTIRPEFDDDPAFRALGWLEGWGIQQFFKIVFIGSIPHVHLGFEGVAAFLTIPPVSSVPLVVVVGTERISTVVSVATVTRVGKQNVLVLVIADPVPAAVGLGQLSGLPAQPATRLARRVCRFAFGHLPIPFRSNDRAKGGRRLLAASPVGNLLAANHSTILSQNALFYYPSRTEILRSQIYSREWQVSLL